MGHAQKKSEKKTETAPTWEIHDASWSLDRLMAYAKRHLGFAEFFGKRSAQQYYLTGCALRTIRDKYKRDDKIKRPGQWMQWVDENGIKYRVAWECIKIADAFESVDHISGYEMVQVVKIAGIRKEKPPGKGDGKEKPTTPAVEATSDVQGDDQEPDHEAEGTGGAVAGGEADVVFTPNETPNLDPADDIADKIDLVSQEINSLLARVSTLTSRAKIDLSKIDLARKDLARMAAILKQLPA